MTRREEIKKILEKEAKSVQQLANIFQTTLDEILGDLHHISISAHRKLKIIPAVCKNCGFVFRERSKIKKPSRCPRCKEERIQAQMFRI